MNPRTRFLPALAAASLLFAACSGSDESSSDSGSSSASASADDNGSDTSSDTGGDATAEEAGATEAPASNCAATSGTYEDIENGTTAEVSHAIAARLADGAAYTVYLSDSELSLDDISTFSGPEAAAGQTLVSLAVTTFNGDENSEKPAAGQTIEYNPDFGVLTFRVAADTGSGLSGNNKGAAGTVTVTNVDGNFCGEVAYTSDTASFTATFDATTKDI